MANEDPAEQAAKKIQHTPLNGISVFHAPIGHIPIKKVHEHIAAVVSSMLGEPQTTRMEQLFS